jgi:hypothetical protein
MNARVREKNTALPTDLVQSELEKLVAAEVDKFFKSDEIKKYKLKSTVELDIMGGALVTLFVKQLAYHSAKNPQFDYERYLEKIFESMAHLFAKCRENFIEVLKDKDEKNSSSH